MNKVFIITGAADGIGRACAVALDNMFPDSVFGLVDIQESKLSSSAVLLKKASTVEMTSCLNTTRDGMQPPSSSQLRLRGLPPKMKSNGSKNAHGTSYTTMLQTQ